MTVFAYKAKKISGEEISGERDADDRFSLASDLRKEGYYLTSGVRKKKRGGGGTLDYFLSLFGSVPLSEKMIFARNLAVMIGSGISAVRALEILSRQTQNKKFSEIISALSESVKKGKTLSEAMQEYGKVFDNLFVSMVKSGEASGSLEDSLKLVSQQMERDYNLRRKVRGAFTYPAIIVSAMIAIGVLMMVYVVPSLVQTFDELNIDLPASTVFIISASNIVINYSLVLTAVVILLGILFVLWIKSSNGKKTIAYVFLRVPVISGLVKKINSARTARTLSSLIGSGVDIVEALSITENVVQNYKFKKVIGKAKSEIQKGNKIADVFMEESDLYPLLVGEMMSVGEETGQLSSMLLRIAEFYEEEVAETTKDLSTIIEPVLMVVIGAVVGFFAISMIKPLYSITAGF